MSITSNNKHEKYNSFDWLRTLFAIQVVAIHTGIASSVLINPVPAFIAISGFVVFASLERRPALHFFISRALRVLPLLFTSFIAVAIIWDKNEMFRTILYWLWPFGTPPENAVVWSLMYEEVLYVTLFLLVACGLYKRKYLPVLLCATCIAASIYLPKSFITMWALLSGAFLMGNIAYKNKDYIKNRIHPIIATIIFAISIITVFSEPYNAVVRQSSLLIDFFSFAAMLVFAIAGPKLPDLKIDISYSLYLTHCLVRAFLLGLVPLGFKMFWFVLLTSIPICLACWYFIEKPALRLKTRLLKTPSSTGLQDLKQPELLNQP
ncbi:acyltransferase [Pseudomonas frederiksbergensis]|nr:acyltransferase [Pseudomonas frederiksbergensis]